MNIFNIILAVGIICGTCKALHLPKAKTLTVDCMSQGNTDDFKHRLKWRQNAEDKTTFLLFEGEQLNIHFELSKAAVVDVIDVRFSNDGATDEVKLMLDEDELGRFKTHGNYAWGSLWNKFDSSGPIGGHQPLEAGKHLFGLTVLHSDKYGLEIDYIRLSIQGAKIHFGKKDFVCVHNPVSGRKGISEGVLNTKTQHHAMGKEKI